MKTVLLGKCNTIDWQELINNLKNQKGEYRTYDATFYKNIDGRFDEIINLWNNAGYDKSKTVEWINFYPEKHFDRDIINKFEEWTNTTCVRAWISKIKPGRYAPYHIDIDDQEEEYLKRGNLIRFTAHPCIPAKGQVLIVGDTVFHMVEQGSVYRWSNYREWHGGGNCSFEPKYLFNFLGVE